MADIERDHLVEAVSALKAAEKAIGDITVLRKQILDKLDELGAAVTSLPQVQLELRIARLRISALLQPDMIDPDKTPIEPVRRRSEMSLRMPPRDPKKGPLG